MLCPKARLVYMPADAPASEGSDGDADGAAAFGGSRRSKDDSKALISFVVPKSSFRPLFPHGHASSAKTDGEADGGSMEVQCRDVRVRELPAGFDDVDALYRNLAAIDVLLQAGSAAATSAAA